MSIIVLEATFDGETLVHGDEFGCFTTDDLCAGGGDFPEDFPDNSGGGTAMATEEDADPPNGFAAHEAVAFKIWIEEEDQEYDAEVTWSNIDVEYLDNRMLVVRLAAQSAPDEATIEVSELEHDFGTLRLGQSTDWMFEVTNVGRENLVISGMAIDDDNFSVPFEENVEIEMNDVVEFTVTYDPEEQGAHEASLTIASNDDDVVIRLNGTAEPALPPTLVVSPENLSFGEVIVEESLVRILELSNGGDEILIIDDISIDSQVFTFDFGDDIEIASGESFDLEVTFTPTDIEAYSADMTIHSNDRENENTVVRISGRGVDEEAPPQFLIEEEYSREIDDETLYFVPFFGLLVSGEDRMVRLHLLNEGVADLIITDIVSDNEVFSTNFNDEMRIRQEDNNWYIELTFSPEAARFYDATLTFSTNDPDREEFGFNIAGVGGEDAGTHFQWFPTAESHSILVQSTILNDAEMVEGDEIGLFTDQNVLCGGGPIDADGRAGLRAWGDDAQSGIIDGFLSGGDDEDGETFHFKVWDADQDVEAWAVISENINGGPEGYSGNGFTVINLVADLEGPQPRIVIPRTRHYFGEVSFDGDDSADWTFDIQNRGEGALEIESIVADFDEFTTDFPDEGVTINEGDAPLTVEVVFDPTQEGRYNGRLMITSNDPVNGETYVDVIGDGVHGEARNPNVAVPTNHYFGVAHLEETLTWILEIESTGDASLEIQEINIDGAQVFNTNWPNQIRMVDPGNTYNLEVSFTPDAEEEYIADIVILTNVNEEPEIVPVRGHGMDSEDHFLELNTGRGHLITVLSANITTLQDFELPLFPGDEVAVFTPEGLCAGHVVVEEAHAELTINVYANDGDNDFKDGFYGDDEFTFIFWDITAGDELDCVVEYVSGPEVFELVGETEVNLSADAVTEEPLIWALPYDDVNNAPVLAFPPVQEDNEEAAVTRIFTIQNIGGENLAIESIESDMQVFTHNFEDRVVLQPDGELEVEVTFAPTAANPYEGTLTVTSTDPHGGEYELHPVGMGSDDAGHFAAPITDSNHGILFQEIIIGEDGLPSINSELGVFTEAGFCAGATVIDNPGERHDLAAFGDDGGTEFLVEGFVIGEEMSFLYWDYGSQTEFEPVEVEILQGGSLDWAVNGFTAVILRFEAMPAIVYDPLGEIMEEDEVSFDLNVIDAEGEFIFTWNNPDEYDENIENPDDIFVEATGVFTWQTDWDDAGDYFFQFSADEVDGDLSLRVVVAVTVVQVADPPTIVEEVADDRFGEDRAFTIDEDSGWNRVIDCDSLFEDPDNRLFFMSVDDPDEIETRFDENVFSVRPRDQINGEYEMTLRAREIIEGNQVRVNIRQVNPEINTPSRNIRSTSGMALPNRDVDTDFEFTLIVTPVDDLPEITEPDPEDANAWRFARNEGQVLDVHFAGFDPDGEDVSWTIQRDGLPDADGDNGPTLTDNDDGTADFHWLPNMNDAGDYDPVIILTGGDGNVQMTMTITINDVPRTPVIEAPDANEEFAVAELELLEITLTGTDPDGNENLTWTIADLGGIPRDAMVIEDDDGAGNAVARWTPTFDDARDGPYDPTFRLTDATGAFDGRTVLITVTNVNREPEQIQDFDAEYTFEEDVQAAMIGNGDLLTYFTDADLDDPGYPDMLVFTVEGEANLGLYIEDNTLYLTPTADFNTWADDAVQFLEVTVTAEEEDGEGDPISAMFGVGITPVNDAPEAFNLESPEDGFQIVRLEERDTTASVVFSWTEAVQNQWEIDAVTYTVIFKEEGVEGDSLIVADLSELSYNLVNPLQLAIDLGIYLGDPIWVQWYVIAMDDDFTVSDLMNNPWRFELPALGIGDDNFDSGIPKEYYMDQTYPNPFNSETTLKYGLPKAGTVHISVWDMHGRRVAVLANIEMAAGNYSTVWNAQSLTSGIYLIKLQSGQYHSLRKAVLVR